MRNPLITRKRSPHLPQLEKAHAQQRRPSTFKNKIELKKKLTLQEERQNHLSILTVENLFPKITDSSTSFSSFLFLKMSILKLLGGRGQGKSRHQKRKSTTLASTGTGGCPHRAATWLRGTGPAGWRWPWTGGGNLTQGISAQVGRGRHLTAEMVLAEKGDQLQTEAWFNE